VSAPQQILARPRAFDTLKLTALSFQSTATRPDDSICTASYLTDGDIGGDLVGAHTDEYLDNQAPGKGAQFEVNFSSVTGDTPELTGAALDTWHPLTSQVDYILSATGVPSKTVSGTLSVREILDTSNLASVSKTMFAELTD